MSATAAITPTSWNHIAADYWSPKTSASPLYIRPSEVGVDYACFDGANTQFKCSKIVPYSGTLVTLNGNNLAVGASTDAAHAVNSSQIQSGALTYILTAGTQPNYTATFANPILAYTTGMRIDFRCHSTYSSGTATLNINGLGAKNLIKSFGGTVALSIGELQNGGLYTAVYDGVSFALVNRSFSVTGTTPTLTGSGGMVPTNVVYSYFDTVQTNHGISFNFGVNFDTTVAAGNTLTFTGLAIVARSASVAGAGTVGLFTGAGYESAIVNVLGNAIIITLGTGTISVGAGKGLQCSGFYKLP